jgi:hypothetical protein
MNERWSGAGSFIRSASTWRAADAAPRRVLVSSFATKIFESFRAL